MINGAYNASKQTMRENSIDSQQTILTDRVGGSQMEGKNIESVRLSVARCCRHRSNAHRKRATSSDQLKVG